MENETQEVEAGTDVQIVFNYSPDISVRNITDDALRVIETEAMNLPEAITKEGMAEIKSRLAGVVKLRTDADKYRKELKSPALKWCDDVERAFRDDIEPRCKAVEVIYKDARDEEKNRLQAIEDKRLEDEAKRIEERDVAIERLRAFPENCIGRGTEALLADLNLIENFQSKEDVFFERYEEAVILHHAVTDKVRSMYNASVKADEDAIKVKEQEAVIEQQRQNALIDGALNGLSAHLIDAAVTDSSGIQKIILGLMNIDLAKFGDRKEEARSRIESTKTALNAIRDGKLATEKAEADLVAEQARVIAEKVELDAKQSASVEPETPVVEEKKVNPVIEAAEKATTPAPEAKTSKELQSEETFSALKDILDENDASLIIEALVAQAIPHVKTEWVI